VIWTHLNYIRILVFFYHPENGHMSRRNMLVTNTQYIYIRKTQVYFLVF